MTAAVMTPTMSTTMSTTVTTAMASTAFRSGVSCSR
jgi:hypothetical protein